MNTLKIKVLLIISNNQVHRAVGRGIIIWSLANVTGCLILFGLEPFFLQSIDDFFTSLALSLIFSSPAAVLAIPVLYYLPNFRSLVGKITLSVSAIVITSVIINGIVSVVFRINFVDVASVLYPFTLTAIVSFFFIARKQFVPCIIHSTKNSSHK
jgi:hypothetical protein